MNVFLERYILAILVALTLSVTVTNTMNLDWPQRIFSFIAFLSLACLCAYTVTKNSKDKPDTKNESIPASKSEPTAIPNPPVNQSTSGANSPAIVGATIINYNSAASVTDEQIAAIEARLFPMVLKRVMDEQSIKRIDEKPTSSAEDATKKAASIEAVKTIDKEIAETLKDLPEEQADELRRKALDDAFDAVMKGIAPAVAQRRADREEAKKQNAKLAVQNDQLRQQAEITKRLAMEDVNRNGRELLMHAQQKVVDTITYTQKTRLGRKLEIQLSPFPEELLMLTSTGLEKGEITVGSVQFHNGNAWRFSLRRGRYMDGKFSELPKLEIIGNHRLLISYYYDPTKSSMLPPDNTKSPRVQATLTTADISEIAPIHKDYLEGKISSDDFITKTIFKFIGSQEIRDALKADEASQKP